jgi:hypothetical protein
MNDLVHERASDAQLSRDCRDVSIVALHRFSNSLRAEQLELLVERQPCGTARDQPYRHGNELLCEDLGAVSIELGEAAPALEVENATARHWNNKGSSNGVLSDALQICKVCIFNRGRRVDYTSFVDGRLNKTARHARESRRRL